MKLLHTSDLHLGKKIKNISLLEDQEEALSSILSIAKTNNIDAMILAGDIFRTYLYTSSPETMMMRLVYHAIHNFLQTAPSNLQNPFLPRRNITT